jgi:hypothetical protein
MKAPLKLLTISICIIIHIGCDPYGDLKEVIQNDSRHDVWLLIIDESTIDSTIIDSILIRNETQEVLREQTELGGINQWKGCYNRYWPFLRLRVDNSDTLHVIIDPNDPSSWMYLILKEENYGGGQCECRLIITDSLIVN